ncbi:MFS transporter [Amycolatopsis antarctica]|uniref:Multidrug efflux pump Tap n=1 Tax=Amycolatopsis antarctica TaxID=1854586 RepID=A0A263CY76_9PSEU|nr:MFS transporter [Amycolatopsis antarctica]OZM71102.1 MFS transporter [Amycolatopsis antarctica]
MPPVAIAYLCSHFLSLLGNGIVAVALPLIVLQTTGSPLSVSAVSAATAVPALLAGLFAGVVLDRVNRRTCSVLADIVSAGAVAAIPAAELLWGLNLWWFVALAVVGSLGDVPGMTAREVLVPAVARHAGVPLERLVGVRQSMTSMALVIGPAAAGTLLVAFEGSTVLLITAITSAAAAVLTLAVPHSFGHTDLDPGHRGSSVWAQLGAGVAVLRRSRLLAGTVTLTVGGAVVLGGMQGLVLPLYFSVVSRPDLLGFVLTALAAGMLAGAGVFAAIGARMSRGFWMGTALIGTTAGFVLIATLSSPAVVFAGAALVGVANAMLGAVVGVLQAERIPDAVRGRVLGLQNAILQVAAPIGIGLAGVVAEAGSPLAAGLAVTAVWPVLTVVVVMSRALTGLEPKEKVLAQQ